MSGKATRDYLRRLSILKKKKKEPREKKTPPPPKRPTEDGDEKLLTMLPPELQDKITGYLSQSDILNCRVVSPSWKKMIDCLHCQDMILQYSRGFRGSLDIPMRNCTIYSLEDTNCRQFFRTSKTPNNVRLLREMSRWNFYEMNSGWNNLSSLEIGWKSMAHNYLFGQFTTIYCSRNIEFLPNLKSLAVGVPAFTGTAGIIKKNGEFIFAQRFPNLESIKLKFVFNPNTSELLTQILTFIRAHSQKLRELLIESITLSFIRDSNRLMFMMECNPQPYEFDSLFELPLNGLRYRFIHQFRGDLNEYHENWMSFLADFSDPNSLDSKLSRIITEKILNYPLRTLDYFGKTIQDTTKYLVELNLSNLTPYATPGTPDAPVDVKLKQVLVFRINYMVCLLFKISMLENCTFLEKLTLVKNGIIFEHPSEALNPVEILNLACLPTSLTYLNIDGFAGSSDDLNEMMSKLINLEILCFKQDGTADFVNFVTGFDLRALEKIIRHPKLTNVKITLASYVRPRFCIRFYQQLMTQYNWTEVFYSIGLTFTRPRITMGRKL